MSSRQERIYARREARRQAGMARIEARIARDNAQLRVAQAEYNATIARINNVPPEYSALPEPKRKLTLWKKIKGKFTKKKTSDPPNYVDLPPEYSAEVDVGGSRQRRRRSLRNKRNHISRKKHRKTKA